MDFLMQPIDGDVDPHLSGDFVPNLRRLAMVTERILSVVDQIHSPCRSRRELGAGPCAASAVGRRYGGGVGDAGWYITEHWESHNHSLSPNFGEMVHWPWHKHIYLIKQLRQNNANLAKLYGIIGNFFGSMENVPFTKRSLRNLRGKINTEQVDDDGEFLRVMGGAPLMTILTDPIQAMELAIKEHYARHHMLAVQVSHAQERKKYMMLLFDRLGRELLRRREQEFVISVWKIWLQLVPDLGEIFDEGASTGGVVGRNVAAGNSNRRWQAKIVGRRYVGGASETGNMGSTKAVLETKPKTLQVIITAWQVRMMTFVRVVQVEVLLLHLVLELAWKEGQLMLELILVGGSSVMTVSGIVECLRVVYSAYQGGCTDNLCRPQCQRLEVAQAKEDVVAMQMLKCILNKIRWSLFLIWHFARKCPPAPSSNATS
ncbi:hypothetical protein TRIUR3_04463 [Triticum urartu]|uniref:Uncharacterized protein n=1 Tax=Triticum urartu TaxID=4572 RepID=M7Y869_TRIUA|nr:hypothetical protein TRIUR3_04463 [Triticum urartu]